MTRFFKAFGLLLLSFNSIAQNNVIKLNIPSLFIGNIALSYERALSENKSISLGVSAFPSRKLPFLDVIVADDISETDKQRLKNMRLNGFSITPEFRFYTSNTKDAPRGFYVAPYIKYLILNAKGNYYEVVPVGNQNVNARFETLGQYKVFAGGILIGYQWLVSDRISIDWSFLGLGIGSFNVLYRRSSNDVGPNHFGENGSISGTFGNFADFEYSHTENSEQGTLQALFPHLRSGISIGVAF